MPSEKDIVEETRELLAQHPENKVFVPNSRELDRIPELLRALADEVERLRVREDEVGALRQRERKRLFTVIDIRNCDKCDLCEDHQ